MVLVLVAMLGSSAEAADAPLSARLQTIADNYLARRGKIEGVSGVSLFVDPGAHGPAVEVFSGTDGLPGARPIGPRTLFQIGSNTKHFTAALILKLEAEGKLDIDQTVGHWLPQYPAWAKVSIRSLLDMTSGIPNYSETVEIGETMAADIHHQFTPAQLIAAVYPGDHLPPNSGWFYSNTNNILAALIIEAASGMSYKDALETLIIKPLGLHDTFYSDGPYPQAVLDRLPRGLYENRECLLYQPTPCTQSTLAPLVGHDMRAQNLSWAGAAGAIIGSPRDLATWIRALFALRVFPQKQLAEMTSVVSQKTGLPIHDVSPGDPIGFSLDLGRTYQAPLGGAYWFYEGMTLGFRVIFAYWPQYDLVITAATNSQPPEGENQFGKMVVGGAFAAMRDSGAVGVGR